MAQLSVSIAILLFAFLPTAFADSFSDNELVNRYRDNPTEENFRPLPDFEKTQAARFWLAAQMSELPQYSDRTRSDKFALMGQQEDQTVRPFYEALSVTEKGNVAAGALDMLIANRINHQPGDGGTSDQLIAKLEASIAELSAVAANASEQDRLHRTICLTANNLEYRKVDAPEDIEMADRHREQTRAFLLNYFRSPLGQTLSRVDCSPYVPGAATPLEQLSRAVSQSSVRAGSRFFTPSISVPTTKCAKSEIKAWMGPIIATMDRTGPETVHHISIVPNTKGTQETPCGIHLSVKRVGFDPVTKKNLYAAERRNYLYRSLGSSFEFTSSAEAAERY